MHRESGAGSYRRFPKTVVETDGGAVRTGFDEIRARLAGACRGRAKTVLTVECYPGVDQRELLQGLQPLQPALVVHSDDLAFEPEKIDALLAQDMTDDPVFGILTVRRLEDYFYLARWTFTSTWRRRAGPRWPRAAPTGGPWRSFPASPSAWCRTLTPASGAATG